ncbi:hypothetical protein [Brevundimonas diminuta]|jgi:hypothetical protein|uniref:hypothetical protein n=1 Tax=Brevundimonas diminuta TaxID=293 RepID=UPI0022B03753|nr:hypothetical protein [Brevundimonas diminuta]MCZ4109328.1 hypothetical protein [Brevundimonas diminuta]
MTKRLKAGFAAAGLLTAGIAGAAAAQAYLDPQIAYSYVLYEDAAKTTVIGYDSDRGCVVSGNYVYAQRVQLHTPYYDATPMYVCTGGGPYLPPDW